MTEKQKNTIIMGFLTGKSIRILVLLPVFLFFGFSLFPDIVSAAEVPVYRFYSTKYKSHLYTASEAEKDNIIANWPEHIWKYQKVEFNAYDSVDTGLTPVYRFWSRKYRTLYYTISESQKNNIIANWPTDIWEYQGIKFYVATSQQAGLTATYRFWSPKYKSTYLTTSPGQKNCMEENYSEDIWRYEGIMWWVPEAGADLSPTVSFCGGNLGPNITVGIWSYNRSDLRSDSFRIEADDSYKIKDRHGGTIATLSGDEITEVEYDGDKNLRIFGSIPERIVYKEVIFEAANGKNSTIIFNTHRPNSSYDEYRGGIKLRYSDATTKVWVINTLPIEHYIWGMGEITGTGDMDYNRVMTTAFRTYGYWKLKYSTKYATEGFKVDSTPGNQIYRGYEWEETYPRIKQAAQDTQGKVVKHGSDFALTPYSSWTDGRTRSFEEHWGSDNYPWCQSVSDPYGDYNGSHWDNPYKSTSELVSSGNHMVGISAHGALDLASDHGWSWSKILKYYLTGVEIVKIY